ncbi:hypothetical protein [Sphingomonas sp.]|uniref:hypothetical protein n=1 Tax=Sphingomonas sp. TaxID=28214 RepID=UPI003B007666
MNAAPSRWRFAVLPLVSFSILLPNLMRDRHLLAGAWPAWRGMILDTLLVAAGAVLVAGVAFAVHAWREAKRHA